MTKMHEQLFHHQNLMQQDSLLRRLILVGHFCGMLHAIFEQCRFACPTEASYKMESMLHNIISVRIFEVHNRIHNAIKSHLLLIIVWVGGDETVQQLPLSC